MAWSDWRRGVIVVAMVAPMTGCNGTATNGRAEVAEADAGAEVRSDATVADAGQPLPPPAPRIDAGLDECAAVTAEAETIETPLDIVWVIDDSGSMRNEADRVQAEMNRFAAAIIADGFDPRVVVITEAGFVDVPPPLGTDDVRFLPIDRSVSSSAALRRLVSEAPRYLPFLRGGAVNFIAVTDDESSINADEFDTQIREAGVESYVLHAIASENIRGDACEGAADPGDIYAEVATKTGGLFESICTDDWSGVFDRLREGVVETAALPCAFAIPAPPEGDSLDFDRINVEVREAPDAEPERLPRVAEAAACGAAGGWHYDAETPSEVRLCPASCDAVSALGEARIDIALGCATTLR